eukprot:s3398_g7.t1
MSPKDQIPIKRLALPCCAGKRCNRGCYVRSDTGGVQHAWQNDVACPCCTGRGGARKRARCPSPSPSVGSDSATLSETEPCEEQGEQDQEDEGGTSGSEQEEAMAEDEASCCLEAGWAPLSQPSTTTQKQRKPLDFTQAKYLADHKRVGGRVKNKLLSLAQTLRVKETRLELWLSYWWFLLHCLLRMTGRWAISDVTQQEWMLDIEPLSGPESAYFLRSIKPLESSQRRRAPFAVALFAKLRDWSPRASEARIFKLWFHLVAIMYYIGTPEFLEEVLLNPPSWEATGFPQVFIMYLNGEIDDYTPWLANRLRAYALSRQSLRRWFDWTDGTRLHIPNCQTIACRSRCRAVLRQSCFFSGTAPRFLDLKRMLEHRPQQSECQVRRLTRKFMLGLLQFPLLGRPSALNKPFLSSIHCYWSKFLFSCACNVLRKQVDAPEELLRQVDERFTFIGPAPRALFGALRGDASNPKSHRRCLGDLRHVRDWIGAELRVQHALCNIQIAPCDFQRFVRAREAFQCAGGPAQGIHGAGFTSTRGLLLSLALCEESMLQARAVAVMQHDWVKQHWTAPCFQRSCCPSFEPYFQDTTPPANTLVQQGRLARSDRLGGCIV